MNGKYDQNGFTLLEVIIVVAIVGIMSVIAIPSLSNYVNQTRLDSVKTLLINDINTARSEAIKSNTRVAICPANAGGTDCNASTDWAINGWLICPASGAGCDAAASSVVIRPAAQTGVVVTAASTAPVIFRSIGTPTAATTFALSGKTGTKPGTLSVTNTGFVSYAKN